MTLRQALSNACAAATLTLLTAACSTTRSIPPDDQLFVGLKPIAYVDDTIELPDSLQHHLQQTKQEVEAALATAPNGALFGSSYYRLPWSWRLWVYGRYANSNSALGRWIAKTFGRQPVLMSKVNPTLRASVAKSVLAANGYMRASVDYKTIDMRNPRKAKIAYTVRLDTLFLLDTISYTKFPGPAKALIDSTKGEATIASGHPFAANTLEAERTRISTLLRDNGYYYFQPSYTTYLADTMRAAGHADLRLQLASDLPEAALHPWYLGTTRVVLRRTRAEQLTDSLQRRHLTIHYGGKRPPIKPGMVLRALKLRPGQPYSYDQHQESLAGISATGVFSNINFQFKPRTDTDTLDLTLSCTLDQPYDFYVEANAIGRTIGRYGPEMKIGLSRRNAFRGGERLDINLHGSYEWQHTGDTRNSSYQYGAEVSVEFPRLLLPWQRRRNNPNRQGQRRRQRFYATPATVVGLSSDIVRRPGFYKMHLVKGELTYNWQKTAQSRHTLSPLTLKYQYMNSHTKQFEDLLNKNLYLTTTMEDQFIPKMRYTYVYTSPANYRNPIRWETTVEEAGNVTALYDLATGKSWNQVDKTLFRNPYAQFLRVETDLTKTWKTGTKSSLVAHFNGGLLYYYGNSGDAPFSEQFYAGGANSVRAFGVRNIGPGGYVDLFGNKQFAYIIQNGDIKLQGNLEYRTPIFGNLHGAVFLDAGNVWRRKVDTFTASNPDDPQDVLVTVLANELFRRMKLRPSTFFDQVAVGTGIGLRYDLGFLVIRLDWGIVVHAPYDTGKAGYFNAPNFHDAQTLHLAVGYPF